MTRQDKTKSNETIKRIDSTIFFFIFFEMQSMNLGFFESE